jgi:hypothetical protein
MVGRKVSMMVLCAVCYNTEPKARLCDYELHMRNTSLQLKFENVHDMATNIYHRVKFLCNELLVKMKI